MLSRKRSRACAYADDNSPLVVQDVNPSSPLAFELGHAKNQAPNRFGIGRQVTLAAPASRRLRRSGRIHNTARGFLVRDRCSLDPKRTTRIKVPPQMKDVLAIRSAPQEPARRPREAAAGVGADFDQPVAAFAMVLCDLRSKKRA